MAGGEIIFGRQPVLEVLKAGRRELFELTLAVGMKPSRELTEIRSEAAKRRVRVSERPRQSIESQVGEGNHQGVALRCGKFPYAGLADVAAGVRRDTGRALVLFLDHVQDPQNLGALLRTAETAGATGIVIPADRAVGVTPVAVRASAGASEHLCIARVPNLVQAMGRLKKDGLWLTGLEACDGARPYTEVDFKGDVGLVVGSEGSGLGRLVRENCDFLAVLPMRGRVTSLNASVAGAILIYEVLRQQGAGS